MISAASPAISAEHPERDRLGPDRALRLGLDGRCVVDLQELQQLARAAAEESEVARFT